MKHIAFAFLSALSIVPSALPGEVDPENGIACPTALDRRWVHILYDFKKDEQVATMTNIVATAKAHGYTGVILGSSCGLGMLHLWDKDRRSRLMSVKKACDEAELEIAVGVWSIGYAKECFFPIDHNLGAAAPVFDTRYRVADGKCIYKPVPAKELLDVPSRVHSPRRTNDVADMVVPVKPRRSYRLTIRARSPKGKFPRWPICVSVQRTDSKVDYIQTRPFYVKADGTEQTFTLDFPSLAEKELRITCRGYNRTFPSHADIISMKLEKTAPQLAIRRHGTPITVRNSKTGRIYDEKRDYAEIPRAKTVWPGPWVKQRFAIVPLKGGAINEGDDLSVDCYCSFPVYGKYAGACMAAPELEPIMDASAEEIARILKPRLWLLSYDEVRSGGGCRDCLRIGDMAHIYAEFVKKSMKIVRRHVPNAEFIIWNDMVDPFYMNDNGKNAGLYSSMKGVWDLLPPDIGIGYWTYRTREKGMAFFSGQKRPLLVCAYYDEKVLKHSLEWADIALRTPGTAGIVYCTWGCNWELLGEFGDMARQKAEAAHRQTIHRPQTVGMEVVCESKNQ